MYKIRTKATRKYYSREWQSTSDKGEEIIIDREVYSQMAKVVSRKQNHTKMEKRVVSAMQYYDNYTDHR
jgi:hypothetical protein